MAVDGYTHNNGDGPTARAGQHAPQQKVPAHVLRSDRRRRVASRLASRRVALASLPLAMEMHDGGLHQLITCAFQSELSVTLRGRRPMHLFMLGWPSSAGQPAAGDQSVNDARPTALQDKLSLVVRVAWQTCPGLATSRRAWSVRFERPRTVRDWPRRRRGGAPSGPAARAAATRGRRVGARGVGGGSVGAGCRRGRVRWGAGGRR